MDVLEIFDMKTEKETETIACLATCIWTEYYTAILGKSQVSYMLEHFQSKEVIWSSIQHGTVYWLLKKDDVLAGYVSYECKEKSLFLSKLYLKKQMRGKRMGRTIVHKMINIAQENNLTSITLTVNKHNTSSLAAYKKLGFKKIREQITDIGQGYVMDDDVLELRVH